MAQYGDNLRAKYAENREYLEHLMDFEHLLEVTLGGFAVTSALRSHEVGKGRSAGVYAAG